MLGFRIHVFGRLSCRILIPPFVYQSEVDSTKLNSIELWCIAFSFGHDLLLHHFVIFMLKGIASKQDNFQDTFLFSILFNLFLPFQTLVFNRQHFTLNP